MNSSYLYYPLSGLLNAITSIVLGIFVLSKNRKSIKHITFALFCLSMTIWSGFYFAWLTTGVKEKALFYCHAFMAGAIFIPSIYLHHILVLLGLDTKKRKIILTSYVAAFIFSILNFTPYFISDVQQRLSFKYWPTAGPVFSIFLIAWSYFAVYSVYEIVRGYKDSAGIEKNRMRYVLIGTIIGWIGGGSNYLLWYDIPVLPVLNITISMYMIMIAYAIVRHQLMDIEILIKKTLVFAGLLASVFAMLILPTLIIQEYIFRGAGTGGKVIGLTISGIIIMLALRRIENFLINATDKYLFQKKYDYRHLVRQFMDELKTMVLNAHDIAQSTLDFLNSSIRTVNSAILMYNKFTNKYDVIASVGLKDRNFKISDSTGLVNKLRENGTIINLRHEKILSDSEKKKFSKIGAELFIPLAIHNDLLGILCLGKKKSDEEYNDDDIGVLSDLSGALSIAINNAQLFDERADAEKRAMVGTLATGINHEIGNPLNIISIKLQSFRILAQQGLLEKKSKEEIINEVNNIAEQCLESAQRISDITKKVSEFAKPNKKLALDEVSVEEAINETVSILKHELDMARIKLERDIKCKSPYVMTDRGQLKQILFNLIKNAAQAIKKENGRIVVDVDKHGKDGISIKISDNGPGIPAKDIDKIFTPFYTTKEPGKGTGLGLALVNRLVERNNGKIEVNSQEGQGTVFTLIFKGHCYE